MGGASRSQLVYSGGKVYFKGEVKLGEKLRGFASVRSKNGTFDLKAFEGVLLREKRDGKTYRLNVNYP